MLCPNKIIETQLYYRIDVSAPRLNEGEGIREGEISPGPGRTRTRTPEASLTDDPQRLMSSQVSHLFAPFRLSL